MASQKGKTALITGASSGIGKELAHIHAERGGDLVIVARSEAALQELKSELEEKHGVSVQVIVKDLTKAEAAKELYDTVRESGITINYLCNNAGVGGRGKFHEREWEQDRAMINLNIMALTALTRFFLPEMVNRNEGRILNTSSTAAFMPGPLQAVYYASKSFVTFFSNALSEELYDTNITVTALMPGATETKFAQVSGMDKTTLFSKTVSARSVAEEGYNGMLRGKLDVVAGLPLSMKMMMWLVPFIPKRMKLRMIRKMQEVK